MARLTSGNPAERPGAVVHYPQADPLLVFDPHDQLVTDTRNGDRFRMESGERESPGRFTLSHPEKGLLASGSFFSGGGGMTGLAYFDVAGVRTEGADGSVYRMRADYDLSRIASFIRACHEGVAPHDRSTVLVVDARDEYAEREAAWNRAEKEAYAAAVARGKK